MSVVKLGRVPMALAGLACWLAVAVITASPLGAQTDRAGSHTVSLPTSIEPQEWAAFVARYVDGSGRVIDVEKNACLNLTCYLIKNLGGKKCGSAVSKDIRAGS